MTFLGGKQAEVAAYDCVTASAIVPADNRRQLHIAMTALHILVKPCVPSGTVAQSVSC